MAKIAATDDTIAGAPQGAPRMADRPKADPARLIDHVEVRVEAVLGDCSIKVSELAALEQGAVIALDRQINEAVEIRVNGVVIGHGEVVTVDDKFAVRITGLGG